MELSDNTKNILIEQLQGRVEEAERTLRHISSMLDNAMFRRKMTGHGTYEVDITFDNVDVDTLQATLRFIRGDL